VLIYMEFCKVDSTGHTLLLLNMTFSVVYDCQHMHFFQVCDVGYLYASLFVLQYLFVSRFPDHKGYFVKD
jgi:hypothetical protein